MHFFIFNCNFTQFVTNNKYCREPFCVDSYFVELKKMMYTFLIVFVNEIHKRCQSTRNRIDQ